MIFSCKIVHWKAARSSSVLHLKLLEGEIVYQKIHEDYAICLNKEMKNPIQEVQIILLPSHV